MPATEPYEPQHPTITVGGAPLPNPIARTLFDLEVESTYNRPDVCFLTFDIDANTEIPSQLELGKPLDVAFKGRATTKIFQGEITAVEFDATENRSVILIQAEDKFHRLFRGDNCRPFLESTVSDAVKKVISTSGVPVGTVESTTSKHPFQMQQNISDGAFLVERAREVGFHTRAKDGKIFWGKVGAGGDSAVTLELKEQLLAFNCRATASTFVKDVTVRSWDVKAKAKIEVKLDAGQKFAGRKDGQVNGAFPHPSVALSRSDLGSADEATKSAQAVIDRSNELNLQAEGTCRGDARLAVDKEVTIKGVNTRFDGKYRISHLRHRYSAEHGFMTEFSCRGVSDQSLSSLVAESAAASGQGPDRSVFDGVTVGVVTDNMDPDDLGRVMVKLPSLHNDHTTHWVRVVQPGGGGSGAHHGWYLLPEKDDEVLVAFEQGDAKRGYILGGLLNGVHKPFYKGEDVLESGKVNQHAFRLKSGAHLLFDEKSGKEKIEIKNKDGCFTFSFTEEKGVEIKHSAKGEKFSINNKGDITITSTDKNITIEAPMGALTLKAQKDITIESQTGNVKIKAGASGEASVEGMTAKLKGTQSAEVSGAMAKLEGQAQATVKAAMVMIN